MTGSGESRARRIRAQLVDPVAEFGLVVDETLGSTKRWSATISEGSGGEGAGAKRCVLKGEVFELEGEKGE